MKAFGFNFNVGIDGDKGGVVFDKTIEKAIKQIKDDIKTEYKDSQYKRAMNSLQVYDLEYSI